MTPEKDRSIYVVRAAASGLRGGERFQCLIGEAEFTIEICDAARIGKLSDLDDIDARGEVEILLVKEPAEASKCIFRAMATPQCGDYLLVVCSEMYPCRAACDLLSWWVRTLH